MVEGIFVNEAGDRLRGVTIFNVRIGEPAYVEAVLRNEAHEVADVAREYIDDPEEEYPPELWTLPEYSPQHNIIYWLRTCTPEETEEMAELVDAAISKLAHAATGIKFNRVANCEGQIQTAGTTQGKRYQEHDTFETASISGSPSGCPTHMH
jgi:hypothetical protein